MYYKSILSIKLEKEYENKINDMACSRNATNLSIMMNGMVT